MLKKEMEKSEYNKFYGRYIDAVPENTSLITGYSESNTAIIDFFTAISEEKFVHRYLPEKWSIKEILQHIVDTERIFALRFLRIARNDKTPLPGYDQDDYIEPSDADKKTKAELIEEFVITRAFSTNIVKSINKENLKNIGTVSNSKISARACAFLIIGHANWHMNIIKERYL